MSEVIHTARELKTALEKVPDDCLIIGAQDKNIVWEITSISMGIGLAERCQDGHVKFIDSTTSEEDKTSRRFCLLNIHKL